MIYMDNCSTTRVAPEVLERMLPYFSEFFGNAASRHHRFGWQAAEAIEEARFLVGNLLQVDAGEIVFTSGATEAINLAIKGIWEHYKKKGNHIVTTTIEHKAVLDSCDWVQRQGGKITYVPVDKNGLVDLQQLEEAITDQTILVSVMWANNETGVIQPMDRIGQICANKGVLCMSDATQALGKIPVNPSATGIQLLAFSAHKFYGPKGVGGLFIQKRRPAIKPAALLHGGGHEGGFRSGTLNVPGIVGMGAAAALADQDMEKDACKLADWRNFLEEKTTGNLAEVYINGKHAPRLPQVSNMTFRFTDGTTLLAKLNGKLALSSGSACTSGSLDPSHVLRAMGLSANMAKASLRFSLGKYNSEAEIDFVIGLLQERVTELRSLSPLWEMYLDGTDMKALGWGMG